MNLTSKKARALLALCSTSALAAGGLYVAQGASAAGSLTLSPSATSATMLNLGAKLPAETATGCGTNGVDGNADGDCNAATDLGTDEVQTLALSDTPGAGTFTVSFGGTTTAALAFDVANGALQTALEGLTGIGAGKITVGGAAPNWTLTFSKTLGNVAQVTADGALLTEADGTTAATTVGIATTTPGVLPDTTGTAGLVDNLDMIRDMPNAKLASAAYGVRVNFPGATSLNSATNTYLVLKSYTSPAGGETIAPETVNVWYKDGTTTTSEVGAATWFRASGDTTGEARAVAANVLDFGNEKHTAGDTAADVDHPLNGEGYSNARRLNQAGGHGGYDTNIYLTADKPGTYVVYFVDDNGNIDASDDAVSSEISLNVLDVNATTTYSGDDWRPAVSSQPASAQTRSPITATVPLSALALQDARGTTTIGSVSVGHLASRVQDLVGLDFTVTDNAADAGLGVDLNGAANACGPTTVAPTACDSVIAVDKAASSGSRTVLTDKTAHRGNVTAQAYFDTVGDNLAAGADGSGNDKKIGIAGTTEVVRNDVAALTLRATKSVGSIKQQLEAVATADRDQVSVKTGTAAVTYTARVTGWTGTTPSDKSARTVFFDIDPGVGSPRFTTNATTVDAVSYIYSAMTNAEGVASITVTSDKTAKTTSYNVKAVSGVAASTDATPDINTLTATYEDSRGGQIRSTNTAAELAPVVTASNVSLKGELLDQFEAVFQPPTTKSTQIHIASPDGSNATGSATLTAGTFTYSYVPKGTPSVGQTDVVNLWYDDNNNGNPTEAGTDVTEPIQVKWSSAESPASIAIAVPVSGAQKVELSSSEVVAPGQESFVAAGAAGPAGDTGDPGDASTFGSATAEVKGSVADISGQPLSNKTVTLTATDGVYFSKEITGKKLVKTIDVNTNASGVFEGRYAFFTKAGSVKITATSGTATKEVSLTTEDAWEGYTIAINDVTTGPGQTAVLTGTVKDMFGNGVPGYPVHLSLADATLGNIQTVDPVTNDSGVFSTPFIGDTNGNGTTTVTAALALNNGDAARWMHNVNAGYPGADPVALPLTSTELQVQNLKSNPDVWVDVAELAAFGDGTYKVTGNVKVEANTITLEAPATRVGPGTVTLTGVTGKGRTVKISSKVAGSDSSFGMVKTVTANADTGAYSVDVTVTRSMTFIAEAGTATSGEKTVEIVTISAPKTDVGGGVIEVKGYAIPGSEVTISKKNAGSTADFVEVGKVEADENGMYAQEVKIIRSTTFQAATSAATSVEKTTTVKSTVVWSGQKALGKGWYLLRANGGPNGGKGTLTFYQVKSSGLKKLGSVKANAYGVGSMKWKTTRGDKKVRVYYTAPGCTKSSGVNKAIRVK